eukprot:5934516-Pleurochrysis_carterae.AAC.5
MLGSRTKVIAHTELTVRPQQCFTPHPLCFARIGDTRDVCEVRGKRPGSNVFAHFDLQVEGIRTSEAAEDGCSSIQVRHSLTED